VNGFAILQRLNNIYRVPTHLGPGFLRNGMAKKVPVGKVIKHIKEDDKDFRKEIKKDEMLVKELKKKPKKKKGK
jgi:hypothetical protein